MVISTSGKENYYTSVSNEFAETYADATKDKGGSGQYFRPHDLICAGYASCLNMTVRMVLEKMDIHYQDVKVKVDLDRSREDKTIFLYDVEIVADMDSQTKELVIRTAKNCPVRKTLSKSIEFQKMKRES